MGIRSDMTYSGLTLPHAIIFDWDLTLVDNWLSVQESLNVARSAYGLETWDLETSKKCCNQPLRKSFPLWFGDDWKRAQKIFYENYNKTHLKLLKAMPGAEDLLRWLKDQSIPAFIVSNKQGKPLRQEAEHLQWIHFFAAIVGSMDAERDKPERAPVDKALQSAGMKADDPSIWFVGDSESDVKCARNAGCTAVLIDRDPHAKLLNPDLTFSDCHELQSLLYSLANNNKSLKEANYERSSSKRAGRIS